jgi:hypothetical protein
MLHKLFFAVSLCLAAHLSYAEQEYDGSKYDGYEPIEIDPEPNWSTTEYFCPLSIKTMKGEHKFKGYSAYSMYEDDGRWYHLKPMSRKNIQYNFMPPKEQAYIFCHYEGVSTEIIIHAKDATACGFTENPSRAVCWKTDPYAGEKQK